MASPIIQEISSVSAVNAGKTVTVEFPIGPTHLYWKFKTTNINDDQLTDIKLYLDSTVIQEYESLAELKNQFNKAYRRNDLPANQGAIWWHIRPEMQEEARTLCSLGTVGLKVMRVTAKVATGVTNPDLKVVSYMDPRPQTPNLVTKIRRHPLSFAAGGKVSINTIPYKAPIASIRLVTENDRITRLKIDATPVNAGVAQAQIDTDKEDLADLFAEYVEPVANTVAYVPIVQGTIDDLMVGQVYSDLTLKPELSGAENMTILMEFIDSVIGE